jgi:starch-binding outer membrane protein, SusD/RagB family
MKNIPNLKYASLILIISLISCKKEFLERVPQDALTVDNYYSSPKALDAATAILYNVPWFDFNDKAIWSYGDLLSGNLNTFDPQVLSFKTFDITGDNTRLMEGWRSLFNVVAHSNGIINDLPKKATANVDAKQVARCVGEARFMRALAYFYLVRLWGPVPIIENNSEKVYNAQIPRNNVEDVYKLIIKDLEYAEANCPLKSVYGNIEKARVSSGSAKALLAKVYLYQKNYTKALEKAEQVINSGEYKLMTEYEDIFKAENNVNLNPAVNTETIFALLWDVDNAGWGVQNTNQAYFAPFGEGLTGFGDGWGSVFSSIDLVRAYESGDKRKRATVMTPGDTYSYLTYVQNGTEVSGYKYPETRYISDTRSSVKKYVVGSPAGNKGKGGFMRTYINTNILRLSEMYLIAAEAIAKGGNTADAKAVGYFNTVRKRAGLIEKSTLTFDDILKERRTEFAMEGDYWYDLGRIDRKKATGIINAQERGTYGSGTSVNTLKVTVKESDFTFKVPTSEIITNPKLDEPPVPYIFK